MTGELFLILRHRRRCAKTT